jgi:hypothetical protein
LKKQGVPRNRHLIIQYDLGFTGGFLAESYTMTESQNENGELAQPRPIALLG